MAQHEQNARELSDDLLHVAGWLVHDAENTNTSAADQVRGKETRLTSDRGRLTVASDNPKPLPLRVCARRYYPL